MDKLVGGEKRASRVDCGRKQENCRSTANLDLRLRFRLQPLVIGGVKGGYPGEISADNVTAAITKRGEHFVARAD